MARIVQPWMIVALAAVAGCHAELTAGTGSKAPATPPPPPPPAASAPAPAVTPTATATPAPAPVEPQAQQVTMKDGKLSIPGNIVYETNKAVIRPESEPTLNLLKDYIEKNPNYTRFRIEGHTDNVGGKDTNLKLSVDRALAVVEWLVAHGVKRERLLAVGFGDARPIADNSADDGRAQNRRTEFHIAETNGKPYRNRDESGGGTLAPGQAKYPGQK